MIRVAAVNEAEAGLPLHDDLKHNAQQTETKRAIPEDYKFDPRSLKPLAKMLWSMSVSLGHALAAHKQFVRLKSSTISPDGLLGGRGYVMGIKDVRNMLHDACEALSALCDTVHDEVNAPHWQPKLSQLEKEDVDRIQSLMGDAERYLQNPEEEAEEDEEKEAVSGHAEWHHPAVSKENKSKKKDPKSRLPDGGDKETAPQAEPLRQDMRKAPHEKQASVQGETTQTVWMEEESVEPHSATTLAARIVARFKQANSTLPVETLPGGPRVQHLDRADTDQTGPFGTYNRDEDMELSDKWRRDDGVGSDYNYPSDWDNDLHEKQAASGAIIDNMVKDLQKRKVLEVSNDKLEFFILMKPSKMAPYSGEPYAFYAPSSDGKKPSAEWMKMNDDQLRTWLHQLSPRLHVVKNAASAIPSDSTPTEGWDFGIGDGNGNDAHGQGAGGYGEGNPGAPNSNPGGGTGNKGVYGPQSGLPHDPGGKVNPDQSDSTLTIENEIGGKGRSAAEVWSMFMEPEENWDAGAELPGDLDAGVARADYYDGPKPDNMQDTAPSTVGSTALPGEQLPAKLTPTTQRPSHNQEHMFVAIDELPGDGTSVNYDYNKDLGPDKTDRFEQQNVPYIKWDDNTHEMRPDLMHQRDPIQGPYVHNDLTERPSNG
jgi:hypothetical protein